MTKAVSGENFLSKSPVSGNNTVETKTSGGKKMKSILSLALTLVLTAATLVGCGCTNQKMDNTSAPTVLPTNEEIWNSTEATTRYTTESTILTETTETTSETTDTTGGINETEGDSAKVHGILNNIAGSACKLCYNRTLAACKQIHQCRFACAVWSE